jgi:L-seryl-tRNA(Ser) seleniumtransferase
LTRCVQYVEILSASKFNMNQPNPHSCRQIPSADRILSWPELLPLLAGSSRSFVLDLLRGVLNSIRQELQDGIAEESDDSKLRETIVCRLHVEFNRWTQPLLGKVINATGVVLHTNLGRAPLSQEASKRVAEVCVHYSNLEFDLNLGVRGKRDVFVDRLLRQVLGCQKAVVVNNNAAAVFLILNTLAEHGEVLISRGELIEIGDSFRIPDILRKSGAVLREVGTTNKTRVSDYREAISERTRLILRVHPSNFHIQGFSSRPSLAELVGLSKTSSVPLAEDLGSGCLADLKPSGIDDEPSPRISIEMGVEVVCFSGDKLLGGPQSGIIAGNEEFLRKIRRNPLFRALRVDKLTMAALEATLLAYVRNREETEIPVIHMIGLSTAAIEERARSVLKQVDGIQPAFQFDIIDGTSMIGGGSTPSHALPTRLISIRSQESSASQIESRLRGNSPPILARVENERVLLDLRTVLPEQDADLANALNTLVPQGPERLNAEQR